MNSTRGLFWAAGVIIISAGAYMLYFEAGLSRWVSLGVVTAGILLFVGLAVMSLASSAPQEPVAEKVRPQEQTTIVNRHPTHVEVDERRRI